MNRTQTRASRARRRGQAAGWLIWLVLPLTFCLRAAGDESYTIDWYTMAGGGGTSTSALFQISDTIGQADADTTMTGGGYSLTGGYWPDVQPASFATTLLITSLENPSGFRDGVSFTATVMANGVTVGEATGCVLFLTNGVEGSAASIGGGWATSAATTLLPRGTNLITAEYAGDNNYSGSTNTYQQVVTNHPPVARVYTLGRTPGTKLHILWSAVSNLWSDADGDALSVAWVNPVTTNGITLQTNSQQILYANSANVNDQIVYAITDGQGGLATNLINITLTGFLAGQTGGSVAISGGSATVLSALPMRCNAPPIWFIG